MLTRMPGLLPAFGAGFAVVVAAASCAIQRGEAVPVTSDSIGNLHLDRPLAALRDSHSGARDTIIDASGSARAGVIFRFPDLTVVAAQEGDSLDPVRPADSWTITGCGGLVRNVVPVCANWQELSRAFGDSGIGSTASGPAVVRLCRLPEFEFEFDVGRGTVGALESAGDLARLPGTARIERITIRRGAGSPCRRPGAR